MVVGDEIKGTNVTGLIGEYDPLFKLIGEEGYTGVEVLIKKTLLRLTLKK